MISIEKRWNRAVRGLSDRAWLIARRVNRFGRIRCRVRFNRTSQLRDLGASKRRPILAHKPVIFKDVVNNAFAGDHAEEFALIRNVWRWQCNILKGSEEVETLAQRKRNDFREDHVMDSPDGNSRRPALT